MKSLTDTMMELLLKFDTTIKTVESASKTKDSAITEKYTIRAGKLTKGWQF